MNNLIDQIKLFCFLKLRPISEKELRRWECEIEKDLIQTNKIKECYVLINKINDFHIYSFFNEKQQCGRILRQRKKPRCCKMCE